MLPSRLGPYEVLSRIGAGGMGEVYRGRDTRLGREVAIKVLLPQAVGDLERRRRFETEARAAGALNHPNIVAVYDVGDADGSPYIVSELVEGESLRDILGRGPVPLKRLLDLAAQIADGLAAAHQAGIVHRDIKPENILVAAGGRAKILDFGLAKPHPVSVAGSELTTQTEAGVILGTFAYMSPEQARGETVDFRTDQFSFGLLMHEMATGQRVFHRAGAMETLAALLQEEVPPLARVDSKVPEPLSWVVERCLAKEADQRYGATTDLYFDLRSLRDRPAGDTPVPKFTPVATDAEAERAPAWSPDGRALAYLREVNGVMQVFTRSLTSNAAAQITQSPVNCSQPFWSPDASRIYYVAAEKCGPWAPREASRKS
ncbi:MAG: protein kinase [Acidobacteria bacterium]|nr:protein kinase [Acidobacteriota bacterium]